MPPSEAPIFVWTVGKVGSTTIHTGLKRAGIRSRHFHTTHFQRQRKIKAQSEENGGRFPGHIKVARGAMKLVKRNPEMPIRIITAVRNPIARNMSAFFNNTRKLAPDMGAQFLEKYPHAVPLKWFDDELKRVTGFDVYEHEFPVGAKFATYQEGRFSILIFRTDLSLEEQQTIVGVFAGRPIALKWKNVGAQKPYADAYATFKKTAKLPEDYVKRMLDNRFVRHFWSESEIRDMTAAALAQGGS